MTPSGEHDAPAAAAAPTRPQGSEPGPLVLHRGETRYSFTDFMAQRRRRLSREIAVILALILGAAGLGYVFALSLLSHGHFQPGVKHYLSASQSFELLGMAALVACAFLGVLLFWEDFWPRPVPYGPKPAPKPLILWLRLIGGWLVSIWFPASLLPAGAVAISIYFAVKGSWVQAAISLAIGIAVGAGNWVMIFGSGVVDGTDLRSGGKVPDVIRWLRWRRRVLWVAALWVMVMTAAAVSCGVRGLWIDFAETLAVALWSGLAVVALTVRTHDGPKDTF